MRPPLSDRAARRQLLLARIALERAELTRDLLALRYAARPASLWRAALGAALGPAPAGAGTGWLGGALGLLRRYPVFTSALLAPLLRRRRWLQRTAIGVAFAGGVLAALWRRRQPLKPAAPPSPPSP